VIPIPLTTNQVVSLMAPELKPETIRAWIRDFRLGGSPGSGRARTFDEDELVKLWGVHLLRQDMISVEVIRELLYEYDKPAGLRYCKVIANWDRIRESLKNKIHKVENE